MARPPVPLATVHVVAEIRQIMQLVADDATATRQTIIERMAPADQLATRTHLATQLEWLVGKGHLIEFIDGKLSHPATHPRYRTRRPPRAPKPDRHTGGPATQESETPAAATTDAAPLDSAAAPPEPSTAPPQPAAAPPEPAAAPVAVPDSPPVTPPTPPVPPPVGDAHVS